MAEEIPGGPEPTLAADQHDDVLGKIDQLLNRHRPRIAAAEAIPIEDGIPILMDVVTGPGLAAKPPPASSRAGTIGSVLILRRMVIALEAEHARLLAQIGGDPAQARMLDRLVAELRRALPAAVRAALTVKTPGPVQRDDDGRL